MRAREGGVGIERGWKGDGKGIKSAGVDYWGGESGLPGLRMSSQSKIHSSSISPLSLKCIRGQIVCSAKDKVPVSENLGDLMTWQLTHAKRAGLRKS